MLSKKISHLKPSPTLALAAKAKELMAQGKDVISLTVGEPDWSTYQVAKDAGIAAINENKTRYTPAAGIPELKKAVANLTNRQLGTDYKPANVTIGAGAKFIIYGALAALCDETDEVIIPAPYWVSYPTMVELAGGSSRIVNCPQEANFKLTAIQLRETIRKNSKILMLNSPSNPTGAEYTRTELSELVEVIKVNPQLWIISDDIYNQLTFSGGSLSAHLLQVEPSLKDRVICINGMSKAYAMTGWRMGWAVGPAMVIEAIANFQSQTMGAPCSISQWASVAAIEKGDDEVKASLRALTERRNFFMDKISGVPMVVPFAPAGAFYLWLNVEAWLGKTYKGQEVKDSRDVAQFLLDDKLLAVVPGLEFGQDGYLRLSFAASFTELTTAIQRLTEFAQTLR